MKKLLLMTGDLACGKTTFGKILAKRYDTNLFYKDNIKEVLGDTIGYSNREENLKLSKAAVEVMTLIFSEFTVLGKNLILEANFRTHELEKLHKIASENGYEVLTLVFRADTRLLHQRYLNRIANENRHPVHVIAVLDDYIDFAEYIGKARSEFVPGETMTVYADDFAYQTDTKLLEKLDAFMLN
ncbi:MAG: AAA family ATPase [Oscillospiraceae bacterium]|nr:AAA family ATPase [Oscillospiraceae bacterium]